MMVLAGFLLLFVIFVFSVFYGTIQEGFGLNDYHWVKDENNEWVMQKIEQTENTYEDASLDSVALAEDMGTLSSEITKKPLVKEPLLASGDLPRGYYKLDQYYMASIPDHYYIYDSDHMAEIPTGYQASEDKTYIFRTSDETQSMINRSNSYTATDLSTYRDDSETSSSSTVPSSKPQSRDPRQFSLDGQNNISQNSDSSYVNTLINQENDSIREQRNESGTMGDYRASPSYSFYDNHTIMSAKKLQNTPGMRGGFCVQHGHSQLELEKKCSKLDKDMCASTNCCVLLGNDTCVAGNEHGPSYQDHYRNPLIQNRDYYYYKGKCYGNCKHQF